MTAVGSTSSVRVAASHAERRWAFAESRSGTKSRDRWSESAARSSIHPLRGRPGCIRAQEGRVAEGDLHVVEAPPDERFQRDGVDVMRLDPVEQLVVELHRLLAREPEQDLVEALVLVATDELAVRFAEAAAAAELGAAGPLLERLPVHLDGGGPVPLPFQVAAPVARPHPDRADRR
jgi:hypothetical protein